MQVPRGRCSEQNSSRRAVGLAKSISRWFSTPRKQSPASAHRNKRTLVDARNITRRVSTFRTPSNHGLERERLTRQAILERRTQFHRSSVRDTRGSGNVVTGGNALPDIGRTEAHHADPSRRRHDDRADNCQRNPPNSGRDDDMREPKRGMIVRISPSAPFPFKTADARSSLV
jgi:hypothetical protein